MFRPGTRYHCGLWPRLNCQTLPRVRSLKRPRLTEMTMKCPRRSLNGGNSWRQPRWLGVFVHFLSSYSVAAGMTTTKVYSILCYTVFCFYILLIIGVLSILDAATNGLALLINTLDLQATPMTPDMTPLQPSPSPAEEVAAENSPLKKNLRPVWAPLALRLYAQSRGAVKPNMSKPPMNTISAQQIAPWFRGFLRWKSLLRLSATLPLLLLHSARHTRGLWHQFHRLCKLSLQSRSF